MHFRCISQSSNKSKNIISSILNSASRDHINSIIFGVIYVTIYHLGKVETGNIAILYEDTIVSS